MNGAPPSSRSRQARRARTLQWVALVAATVAAVGVVLIAAGSPERTRAAAGLAGAFRASASPVPAKRPDLPRLGAARVVETDDVGDPFVLPAPGGTRGMPSARYVLFWTTDWQSNVPTAVSSDLVHWRRVADALPVLPAWATSSRTMTWAPAALRVAHGWVLYFSTQERRSGLECIGSAFSSGPAGPYVDLAAAPMVCQRALGGSIDPSVVADATGASHLIWKSDGNATGAPVGLWEQQLDPSRRALIGVPHRLLGTDEAWQHRIIEGPAMLAASRGGWWLFYSGGAWRSNSYATGVAWCATVTGPCAESSEAPFLAGLPTAVSPGGLETFRDNHGKLWAAYSAFPDRPSDAHEAMEENRVLEIAPVTSH